MKIRFSFIAAISAVALLAGCAASGPKFAEMSNTITPIKQGDGRIYFFRSASMFGAAMRPEIRLNDEVVGKSVPGGFFYVDRPAGNYVAAASTETEKSASFILEGGETKYLRTSPSLGLLVGRVVVELEDPAKAQKELESLSYTGTDKVGVK